MKFSRERLVQARLSDEAALDSLDAEIGREMDATIDFAVASEAPPMSSMFRDVYAVGEPEPEPLRARLDRVLAEG